MCLVVTNKVKYSDENYSNLKNQHMFTINKPSIDNTVLNFFEVTGDKFHTRQWVACFLLPSFTPKISVFYLSQEKISHLE